MHKITHPLSALMALALALIACSVFVGGPELPAAPVTADPAALDSLQAELESAATDSLTTGKLELQFTQEQINAFVASFLAQRDPPILVDPQVVLGEQEMTLFGRAESGMLQANASLSMQFSVDADGKPEVHIGQAELGPMPMPDPLKQAVASAIDEAFTGSIGPAAIGFRLETIDISAGVMRITGRVK